VPNGWALRQTTSGQVSCGAANFQIVENEMAPFAPWRSAPQVHAENVIIKNQNLCSP